MTETFELWIMSGIMFFAIGAVGVLSAWIGWQARKVLPWWPIMRTDERERQEFFASRRKPTESDSF
jgi:hypothetical protein